MLWMQHLALMWMSRSPPWVPWCEQGSVSCMSKAIVPYPGPASAHFSGLS